MRNMEIYLLGFFAWIALMAYLVRKYIVDKNTNIAMLSTIIFFIGLFWPVAIPILLAIALIMYILQR